jgi:bifunctional oligoribonuclease and PAP phosphatase NrnA
MRQFDELKSLLAKPRRVVITTHANPDADAMGSSLGLYHYLRICGHDVTVIAPTSYPEFLHWMPGNDEVMVYESERADADRLISEAEVIFCLDFSGLDRIKGMEKPVRQATCTKVVIDHHQNPEGFSDFEIWDTHAAATAELIFDMIEAFGDRDKISADMANCIYAGIMTDTGSFRHPNATAHVHRVVAELIEHGADTNMVSRKIYDTNSLERIRFMGYALHELLKVMPDKGVAYFVISQDDIRKYKLKQGDTEGLVNYALSIEGVKVAALIKDMGDEIKLSFRSVKEVAVNTFAEKYFSGGGHKNAAGGRSGEPLDSVVRIFEQLIIREFV